MDASQLSFGRGADGSDWWLWLWLWLWLLLLLLLLLLVVVLLVVLVVVVCGWCVFGVSSCKVQRGLVIGLVIVVFGGMVLILYLILAV